MLAGAPTSSTEHVAVNMPAEPQQWRTGVYKLIGDKCYARCEKADRDGPKSSSGMCRKKDVARGLDARRDDGRGGRLR